MTIQTNSEGKTAMKAIPTEYAGTHFRSRLEANFAAHFDTLNIQWTYEPEGFTLANGMNYLPDFHLPEMNTWVEVKGNHMQRVDKFDAFAQELWATFNESRGDGEAVPSDPGSPLCILATLDNDSGAPRFVASRGAAQGYSIFLARCRTCRTNVFSTFGHAACRKCTNRPSEVRDWQEGWLHLRPLRRLTTAKVRQWMPAVR